VGAKGLLQPFSDALKLLTKEPVLPALRNYAILLASPVLSLGLALVVWIRFPSSFGTTELALSIIFILCCLRAGVYPTLGAGWASNSKYALLGRLRAVAQTISYEVSLAITLLCFLVLIRGYNLSRFIDLGQWFLLLSPPLALV
jgi:NADH-ubiquinone oxidoreductase chain 1